MAEENRALFVRHPWAAHVSTGRPPLGPGQMVKYDHELRALDGLGLRDVDVDSALSAVLDFVRGHAREEASAEAARQESGLDDEQWWARNEPLLSRVFDPARYPLAARIGSAAGTADRSARDSARAWSFGLDLMLDGLSALITRSS